MTLLPLTQLTKITTGEAWMTAAIGFLLVIIVLAVLALFVKALSAIVSAAANRGKKAAAAAAEPGAPVISSPVSSVDLPAAQTDATGSAALAVAAPGSVVLDGVSEQDAAVIMAITSDKTGIPLEKLAFLSVKRLNQDPELINVSEQDAAVIMAVTAHRLGKPLNTLEFKSIKLSEE